ncbi:hypothetical protein DZF91_12540 [Actinomadura logoneensis]|uniref:FtsK domain-containing protein n=1 Tax=Actinomadura logoneensis TaxID=2293572 RepID=A0A372JPQ2_9ACTN|nr:hypothetical protein [Actinomadura logoneensis]RFU41308.1 hypothetical protein DZF91_12540 [Actinomadura logoneensis]
MRAWVELADRADRSMLVRETRNALADGARWGWAAVLVAAASVWVARGLPSPATAAAAVLLLPVAAGLAWWRGWRLAWRDDPIDRRAAAASAARRWTTGLGLVAAVVPALWLAAGRPLLGVAVALVVVAALAELAIVTIPARTRARILRRLRIGARAVARDEAVQVGRALWSGMTLDRVQVTYPADWAAHSETRRDDLTGRLMWELCGPPPRTPAEAVRRPDYLVAFDAAACRITLARMPSLPRRLAARDWRQGPGRIVLGQTHGETADRTADGVPLALYEPTAHALIVGGTQHGKSSGVRAWVVDGLTHGVWPGGVWAVDGKGGGTLAPLLGRRGVHAVAHTPEEWAHVLEDLVAPEVARRYAEMLDWRAGRSTTRPDHPRALVVLDELQQVLLSRPDLAAVVETLARQALESGVILWVITQRPDARDAVPGAMRDQLLDRITFGPLSSAGAKMSFDVAGDWHRAMGVAPIPGRALTWIGGVWRTVQVPWLPIPADAPSAERLYPRRAARPAAGDPYGYGPPPPRAQSPASGSASSATPPRPDSRSAAPDDAEYDPATARRRRRPQ